MRPVLQYGAGPHAGIAGRLPDLAGYVQGAFSPTDHGCWLSSAAVGTVIGPAPNSRAAKDALLKCVLVAGMGFPPDRATPTAEPSGGTPSIRRLLRCVAR